MKKRIISFTLALLMVLSAAMPAGIAYGEAGFYSEASVPEESVKAEALPPETITPVSEGSPSEAVPEGDSGAGNPAEDSVEFIPEGSSDTGSPDEDSVTLIPNGDSPSEDEPGDAESGFFSAAPMQEDGGLPTEPEEGENLAPDTEFDADQPFTMAMLAEVDSYSMEMDDTTIPAECFHLEAEDEDENITDKCELDFPDGVTSISGGKLANNVPTLVKNQDGAEHRFSYAHIGNTEVYYMGRLTIYDGETVSHHIFYTTDEQIDKKTVYVVLKEGEQIHLVYRHGTYYKINYQFQDMDGTPLEENAEAGWSYDKIFGESRARSVGEGDHFNTTVTIPRGYEAETVITVEENTETPKTQIPETKKLGLMMGYTWGGEDRRNTITPNDDNKDALIFTDSFSIEDVKGDVTITVKYKKLEQFTFNIWFWSQSQYARGRMKHRSPEDEGSAEITPTEANSKLTIEDGTVTWRFNGVSSVEDRQTYTWEMNQLYINSEPINIPMTTLDDTGTFSKTTTLSTGTVITLSVTSLGGNNGSDGKRAYTLKAENCYEDLTISGGNMVGHIHREFANRAMIGIQDAQYWPNPPKPQKPNQPPPPQQAWGTLTLRTLIDKRNDPYDITAPFRLKTAPGYGKLNVSFTDKEETELQTNGKLNSTLTTQNFIEYLMRTDTANTDILTIKGDFTVVSYDNWGPSEDGYYYCRATKALDTYMNRNSKNGVVLLWFYATPNMYAIDYQSGYGTGVGGSAPPDEHIQDMPGYDNGGENGYNSLDNSKALISNNMPMDEDGHFLFDHWEVLLVGKDGVTDNVLKISDADGKEIPYTLEPGQSIPVTEENLAILKNCLHYNAEKDRNVLTLRAVWKQRVENDPIPYKVNYYLTEVQGGELKNSQLIEEHTHSVNEGANLVSDLWADSKKTLSPVIMEILRGNNDNHTDYTKDGEKTVKWVIYEPATNKYLNDVTLDKNEVNIYLVKQPELSISKEVTGKLGDQTKSFTFRITATDVYGKNLNGTYRYTGSVLEGISGATPPQDGSLTFTGGIATLSLKHGQRITFPDLPVGSSYTVTEVKEGTDSRYLTSYNGAKANNSTHTFKLEADTSVDVVNEMPDVVPTGIADHLSPFRVLLSLGGMALLLLLLAGVWRTRRNKP